MKTHSRHYEAVVLGASMGGFQTLRQIISELPAKFPAAVFVVLHISSDYESELARLFGRDAKLPVVPASNHAVIEPGRVYVAVPDYHLRIDGKHIVLDHGPKHNFHRPAVDPLFTSAAEHYGPRVIGVVLTGALDDGTAGLMEIKRAGGVAIVQDPQDAVCRSMPASALACVPVDHCVPLSEIGALLVRLTGSAVDKSLVQKGKSVPKPSEPELSTHICPECNGPMWCVETGKLLHFHCRIGHAFSGQSLLVEKTEALESALWSAVNALKDKANISKRLATRLHDQESIDTFRDYYKKQAANAEHYAKIITEILLKESSPAVSSSKVEPVTEVPEREGKAA